ncbi:hypothetical protein [Methanolobus halotolerans]|uniref:Uncharacterized protein n=1 Tax=Methanolobus halotolerans TaxID=2052935 RepID=A0A4E0PZD8_9EURY|nr:hypothetical protein [Methanolobus halotolerans]TGC09210.1 hypothetical protein CUN85_07545 [Methanolobus halotolerans]
MGLFLMEQELEEYTKISKKIEKVLIQQLDKIWRIRDGVPFNGKILYFYIEDDNVVVHTKDPVDKLDHVNVIKIENLLNDNRIERYKEELEEQEDQS